MHFLADARLICGSICRRALSRVLRCGKEGQRSTLAGNIGGTGRHSRGGQPQGGPGQGPTSDREPSHWPDDAKGDGGGQQSFWVLLVPPDD